MSVVKILIVEDAEDDRELLVDALRRSGLVYDWRCVATATAFQDAVREDWDAILCDYQLADFDAFEALETVRARGLDIPFILVSGVLGEEAAVAAMRAGAHDFFAKGRLARLRSAIEREIAEAGVRKARRHAEEEKRRLLAELQQALRARDEFLVLASHELRTPLTVLSLQVERLSRSLARPDTAVPASVGMMRRQVDRLAELVDRCLDVTKLASEPLHLSRTDVDLKRVVLDVVERSKDWIDQTGCALSMQPLDSAVGCWDAVRLDSVVTNLLANALKYGAGKPVLISTQRRGDTALLTIRDHGIGIPLDKQPELFQKFPQLRPSDNYGGMGLGLWIVAQVAQAHGGAVHVDSDTGAGATFTVELPTHGGGARSPG